MSRNGPKSNQSLRLQKKLGENAPGYYNVIMSSCSQQIWSPRQELFGRKNGKFSISFSFRDCGPFLIPRGKTQRVQSNLLSFFCHESKENHCTTDKKWFMSYPREDRGGGREDGRKERRYRGRRQGTIVTLRNRRMAGNSRLNRKRAPFHRSWSLSKKKCLVGPIFFLVALPGPIEAILVAKKEFIPWPKVFPFTPSPLGKYQKCFDTKKKSRV